MELTRVRSKIWNEGDYPPVCRQWRLFTRLYLHDLRSRSGRTLHIVIPARPGSDISSAIVTHVTCHKRRRGAPMLPPPCASDHIAGVNVICTYWAHISDSYAGPSALDTGLAIFSAQGTLGAPQRAPPPDITLTVCNCIWGEVAQISAQSFALISFHKNPSPFWLFLWLFYAAWFRAGPFWRLESTQLGSRIES